VLFLLLVRVASVENQASHPLAAALVNYARLHGVEPSDDVTEFELIVGEGVSGIVNGHTIHIGNARMAARLGWDIGNNELRDYHEEKFHYPDM
jgi:Cd2+/Zn2+-exporting ATPase